MIVYCKIQIIKKIKMDILNKNTHVILIDKNGTRTIPLKINQISYGKPLLDRENKRLLKYTNTIK